MKNIEALIKEGGKITVGSVDGVECADTAAVHADMRSEANGRRR